MNYTLHKIKKGWEIRLNGKPLNPPQHYPDPESGTEALYELNNQVAQQRAEEGGYQDPFDPNKHKRKQQTAPPELWTAEQVADHLGIARSTVFARCSPNNPLYNPAFPKGRRRHGKRKYWHADAVKDYAKQLRQAA